MCGRVSYRATFHLLCKQSTIADNNNYNKGS